MTQKTRAERQADLVELIQLEGAELAVSTAMDICRDPKAPAPAKATALTALLRAGGYLAAKPEGSGKKEPYEMTSDELKQELLRIKSRMAEPAENAGVFD